MKVLRDARQKALVGELEQYAPVGSATEDQKRDLTRSVELASSTLPAFSRDTYEPGHFTASAFVLSPNGEKLLLILHKKLDLWLQPGGHVESTDRDHVSAAQREVREETGLAELKLLNRLFDVDVHEIPAFGDQPAHLHHDLRASFQAATEDVSAGDDAADARWFTLTEIADSTGELADGRPTDNSVRVAAARLQAVLK